MKKILLLIAVALVGYATAADTLMQKRAALADPTAFDANIDSMGGAGTAAALVAAEATAPGSENLVLTTRYLNGTMNEKGARLIDWKQVPDETKLLVLKKIAAKATVTIEDATLIDRMPYTACTELQAKATAIITTVPKSDPKRYRLKYDKLQTPQEGGYIRQMLGQELLNMTVNRMNAITYDAYREAMLKRCVKAVKKTRRDANLADNAVPTFEDNMVPIIAALNAPLWAGLPAAMTPYGWTLNPPSYTALSAMCDKACADYTSHTIEDLKQFTGSVMFCKGVTAYNAWKQANP